MNVLTKEQLGAFCKARGINPKKKTAKAFAYELGASVNTGEKKPAKYVTLVAAGMYALHPTASGGRVLAETSNWWLPNDELTLARFRVMLEDLNPIKEEKVAA